MIFLDQSRGTPVVWCYVVGYFWTIVTDMYDTDFSCAVSVTRNCNERDLADGNHIFLPVNKHCMNE